MLETECDTIESFFGFYVQLANRPLADLPGNARLLLSISHLPDNSYWHCAAAGPPAPRARATRNDAHDLL